MLMARNFGHQWEVLTLDLPLTEVHALAGKKHAIKRDILTIWRK